MDFHQYRYWLALIGAAVLFFVKRYYRDERYGKPSENEKLSAEQLFWAKIDKSRNMARNDYHIQCEKLTSLLEAESPEFILRFQDVFQMMMNKAYKWEIWAAAYIINGGCSDDCFMDFRSWLISQGEMVFEATVKTPDSLANLEIQTDEWEGLQYCAASAYERVVGESMPAANNLPLEKPSGKEWNEGDIERLKSMLPELYAKYSEGKTI